MRDIKSLLLVLLSVGLVGTWVYHLYDKTMYSKRRTEIYIKDSAAVADGIRDSMQKIYTATINNLDSKLSETRTNADSLKTQLDTKLSDIYKLRTEISDILKNRGATKADLNLAREKIGELQEKVDELREQNDSMEEEKQKLTGVLDQLNTDMKGLEQNIRSLSEENKNLTEKINEAAVFVASEIKFLPVTINKSSKEVETDKANKVTKLVISFVVQNNISQYEITEILIVITQPDGRPVQNTAWESGTFETKNEGRKTYSYKSRFQYDKGEAKYLTFSINTDSFQSGTYTLQLYHNGIMIGKASKLLQ